MTTPTQERMEIVDGPGKFDLMVALFDQKKEVFFTFEDQKLVPVRITAIELEDGSTQRWLIKGYYILEITSFRFFGYYDSSNRKGWLEPVSKPGQPTS